MSDAADVLARLADVARAKGLLAVEVNPDAGHFKFSVGPAPSAPRDVSVGTDDAAAKAVAMVNRKRERLKRAIGRDPTDDELERLP